MKLEVGDFVDNLEKYVHWEDIAKYDLDTAEAMYQAGRYLYVVFMCQQAIEKLAKGLYVYKRGEEAPRTHNIHHIVKSFPFPLSRKKPKKYWNEPRRCSHGCNPSEDIRIY
jgi:HEPN domain-containing protein